MAFITIPPWVPSTPAPGGVNDTQSTLAEIQASVPSSGASIPLVYGPFQAGWLPCVADYDSGTATWTILGIVGLGEIESIDQVWINGAAPVSGVVYNAYTGTTAQGVDSLLSTANPAWDQTLVYADQDGNQVGIAYIVLQYTNTHYSGFPTVIVEGKGRKVRDPRTATTAYSTTFALMLADMISDPIAGFGQPVNNASLVLAADANETGITIPGAGIAKRQGGLVLRNRRKTQDWIEVLRLYAACWVLKRGDTWYFRIDSNTAADATIGADDQYGLPDVGRADEEEVPTQVEVVYTDDTPDIWVTTSYKFPETLPAGTPRRIGRIEMPGVFGFANAAREAMQAYAKLQTESRVVVWHGFTEQIEREQGDAIIYTHPVLHKELFLRVSEKPVQIEPGLWRVPCVQLDNGDYTPTATPVTVPTSSQPKFIGG